MLPSSPFTDSDVQISRCRFLTGGKGMVGPIRHRSLLAGRETALGHSRRAPTTPWEIWSESGPKVNRLALPQASVREIAKKIDV